MRIAVFVSGCLKQGLDTALPGESRFGQQLSRMLGEAGHEVDAISGTHYDRPSWGNATVVPNVNHVYTFRRDVEYDLALYSPWEHQFNDPKVWEPCTTNLIDARHHLHITFGWGDSIGSTHTCYNNNHHLAFPYVQDAKDFPTDKLKNPYKTFPLPMPIYKELAPINLPLRKNILWSTKDVFNPEWPEGHHVLRIGAATLRAISKLRKKHDFITTFLSTRFFDPMLSRWAKHYDVMGLVKSIPDGRCHALLPRDVLMNIMSTSRITTIVSGLLGSFGESIASGSVPLCYMGHLYRDAADKHGIKLHTFDATEEEIYNCIERLYEDNDFYLSVLADYREELRYYSFAKSYEYFEAMCRELGLNTNV